MAVEFGDRYNGGTPGFPLQVNTNSGSATPANTLGSTAIESQSIVPITSQTSTDPTIPIISAPQAIPSFTFEAKAGKIIAFTNTSLNMASCKWFFGDGTTSTERSPVHIYSAYQSYTVILTVTNSDGASVSISGSVTTIDMTPSANFTYQIGGFAGYFINTSSIYATSYLWDFGDGSTSTEKDPIHTYAKNGTYTVKLTVNGSYTKTSTIAIDTEISLSWGNVVSEDGYKIYHSLDGINWTQIGTTGADITTFGVTKAGQGVDSTNANLFRVTAYNGVGESAASSVVAVQC